ncbi:MAG: hypothetical protein WD096_07265 [Actinomycetota bacterium]
MNQPDEKNVDGAAVTPGHLSEPERATRGAVLGLVLGLVLRLLAPR